jgi:hypothetical protein
MREGGQGWRGISDASVSWAVAIGIGTAQGTTRFISSRNSRLRVLFAGRFGLPGPSEPAANTRPPRNLTMCSRKPLLLSPAHARFGPVAIGRTDGQQTFVLRRRWSAEDGLA